MVKELLRLLDPFYHFDVLWERYVGKKGPIKWVADVAFTLFVAFLIYTALGIVLHTPKPAVIVASSSMEPTLYKGDIVLVRGVSPEEIVAPEVFVDTNLNYRVTPSQIGIKFLRNGIRLYALEVNGRRIPVEENGSIIVYHDDIHNRDVIHRVVLKIRTPNGYFFLTKGDNDRTNPTADQDCILGYCVYPYLVSEDQLIGVPVFVIPRVGLIKLALWPFG